VGRRRRRRDVERAKLNDNNIKYALDWRMNASAKHTLSDGVSCAAQFSIAADGSV